MKIRILFALFCAITLAACGQKTEVPHTHDKDHSHDHVKVKAKPTGNELRIVAIAKIDSTRKAELMPLYEVLVAGSRAEEGCIFYDLHEDIKDPNTLVFMEEWKSQEAIDYHNQSPHMKEFQVASKGMVNSVEVVVIKQVQ